MGESEGTKENKTGNESKYETRTIKNARTSVITSTRTKSIGKAKTRTRTSMRLRMRTKVREREIK